MWVECGLSQLKSESDPEQYELKLLLYAVEISRVALCERITNVTKHPYPITHVLSY